MGINKPRNPKNKTKDNGVMRKFDTGATRTSAVGKNDYDGFLSYPVIEAFGDYMTIHRKQADGTMRDSDNWQKGIPQDAYRKSMFRHFLDVWAIMRGYVRKDKIDGHIITLKEALCALIFNVQGLLHEHLKETQQEK